MAKQVKINPEQLTKTTTSISGGVSKAFSEGVISDDTGTKLVDCASLIYDTSLTLGDTVSKYNDFLNKIANEFKNTDYKISTKIQNDKAYISDGKVNPSDDYFSTK